MEQAEGSSAGKPATPELPASVLLLPPSPPAPTTPPPSAPPPSGTGGGAPPGGALQPSQGRAAPKALPPGPAPRVPTPKAPGPTSDPATGTEVGRFVVDPRGNTMIEPAGGDTVSAGKGGVDTHTRYPNRSNYQRLNPQGHTKNPTPHGHGHLPGTGPAMKGQGPSIDPSGRVVPWNSKDAHWPIK